MTATTETDVDISEFEHDFCDVKCDAMAAPAPPCPNKAEWVVWLKHPQFNEGEPHDAEVWVCTKHKNMAVSWWTNAITQAGMPGRKGICGICKKSIKGLLLHQLLRVMPL